MKIKQLTQEMKKEIQARIAKFAETEALMHQLMETLQKERQQTTTMAHGARQKGGEPMAKRSQV